MPEVTNLKGEQGGVFLSDGQDFSTTDAAEYLVGFICLADTTLTSITMAKFDGTESELVGPILTAGTTVYGEVSAIEVDEGLIQGLNH